jgi:hypothetical protein
MSKADKKRKIKYMQSKLISLELKAVLKTKNIHLKVHIRMKEAVDALYSYKNKEGLSKSIILFQKAGEM